LIVGGREPLTIRLIGLHALLEPLDGFLARRQPSEIVDRPVREIPVLALQGKHLILQARVLRPEKLADLLGLFHPRAWHNAAAGQQHRGEEQRHEVPRDVDVVDTNHPFRLLSETIVRESNPIARLSWSLDRLDPPGDLDDSANRVRRESNHPRRTDGSEFVKKSD
jgi:hypothetical protein